MQKRKVCPSSKSLDIMHRADGFDDLGLMKPELTLQRSAIIGTLAPLAQRKDGNVHMTRQKTAAEIGRGL